MENLKIVMKSILKNFLPFGWPMQTSSFIFLHRKWEDDQHYLQEYLDTKLSQDYPLQVLLFPEGTDKTEDTTARSDAFAKKLSLPPVSNLLHPRTFISLSRIC